MVRRKRGGVRISTAIEGAEGGYFCDVFSSDTRVPNGRIFGEDDRQAFQLAVRYVASMTVTDEDDMVAVDVGESRGRTGVVASLVPTKDGFCLILDDVEAVKIKGSTTWMPVRFFSRREFVETKIAKVTKQELASVGGMLLARLRALETTKGAGDRRRPRTRDRKVMRSKD
jgi:hypothetical protein